MTTKIPALVCVDVEPDTRRPDLNSREGWKGFEESLRLFEELRRGAGVGALFNWFLRMDPQVELLYGSAAWAAERYGAQIDGLRAAGDEVGLHTHAWRRVGGAWVTDHGDQGWVSHCVRVSFEAYERAFGLACHSFRFGDHWMNDETFALVESLGARYELTLEPGQRPSAGVPSDEVCTGRFPDYAKVPREPYRPALEDFRTRGEGEMWVIPVSTTLLPLWPAAPLYRRAVWRARYGRRQYEPLSLALDPEQFGDTVGDIVGGGSARHLCAVVRTDAAADRVGAARVRENLGLLLSHAAAGRVELTTPPRLVAGSLD
jgi:peptidoglycan/xylan/chitin deacetylase (PgdA/CDA1 family)